MDLAAIGEVIGLASGAVGATGKAADTIKTIKGLFDGGEKPDKNEVTTLLNVLATELTAANMLNVQISAAVKTLSQELLREDEFSKEKARYELFQTAEGDIVFQLKMEAANGQPQHFICPVCINRDKLISFVTGDQYYKRCQTDATHGFNFLESPSLTASYDNDTW